VHSAIAYLGALAGKETIADALALPHLVDVGANGWLFRPRDADDLAAKLTRVLTASPEAYVAMQRASLKGVEIHDIARTLDTFEALYRGDRLTP